MESKCTSPYGIGEERVEFLFELRVGQGSHGLLVDVLGQLHVDEIELSNSLQWALVHFECFLVHMKNAGVLLQLFAFAQRGCYGAA